MEPHYLRASPRGEAAVSQMGMEVLGIVKKWPATMLEGRLLRILAVQFPSHHLTLLHIKEQRACPLQSPERRRSVLPFHSHSPEKVLCRRNHRLRAISTIVKWLIKSHCSATCRIFIYWPAMRRERFRLHRMGDQLNPSA